jgi:hypothetical protein
LRILITNNALADRAGTELYVRDLALGLRARGHLPIAYSTRLGEVTTELKALKVPVVDNLSLLSDPPDVIHGHHHVDAMTALVHFPKVPAVYVCHGSTPWEEWAPGFPRIFRYLAVDEACRDRLIAQDTIPKDRIEVLLNSVDLKRFTPRPGLPERPRNALIFSNQASSQTHIGPVKEACHLQDIEVDVVGFAVGNVSSAPEKMLGRYDVIFAKGRAALESLAVGAAVVLCDAAGAGPMVTSANVRQLRPLNFGLRTLANPLTGEMIGRELARYDASDASEVSRYIRSVVSLDETLDRLLTLYQEVIDENQRKRTDQSAENAAIADYLRRLAPRLRERNIAFQQLALNEAHLKLVSQSKGWKLISSYERIKRRLFRRV